MVAGILSVLKIIGIVLLVILAVVLFLLILVLFVPIAYSADAVIPETEFDSISNISERLDVDKIIAETHFSWLWVILRGGFEYPKDKQFTLKVCGIKILPKKKKKEKPEDQEKTDQEEKPDKKDDSQAAESTQESSVQKEEEAADSSQSDNGDENTQEGDQTPENDSSFDDEEEDEPKSFLDVLWKIFDSIDNFLKTPLNVFEKIQYTISRVCDKIDMIKATLDNPIFQRAFELVKQKLFKILKMILPRKCDIKLLFGSADPAVTAEIMGAYGALYPWLYKNVEYTPDFERGVVKADVHLKGHITIFTIVFCTAVCFFNKDVKKTIRRFKKIIKS